MIGVCTKCCSDWETFDEESPTPGLMCPLCFWRDKCHRLEAVNAELLAACEGIMDLWNRMEIKVHPDSFVGKVQAAITNAKKGNTNG